MKTKTNIERVGRNTYRIGKNLYTAMQFQEIQKEAIKENGGYFNFLG